MVWVCPICSSNNDISLDVCTVCGHKLTTRKINTLTKRRAIDLGLTGDIVVPEEFNVIGEAAFKGREDITSVVFHPGVRKIAKEAFCGCKHLRDIEAQGHVLAIGIRAFAECPCLPASKRIAAKYIAEDAYECSLPPKENEEPKSLSLDFRPTGAPASEASSRLSDSAPYPIKLDESLPKEKTWRDEKASAPAKIRRKQLVLLIILSVALPPVINALRFRDVYAWRLALVGIQLFFMTGLVLCKRPADGHAVFEGKLLIWALILDGIYMISVFMPESYLWLLLAPCIGWLIGGVFILVSHAMRKNINEALWLLGFLIPEASLLYTIIVMWKG